MAVFRLFRRADRNAGSAPVREWVALAGRPLAVALCGTLPYLPALDGYFAIDDFRLIASVHDLRWWELPRLFAADETIPLTADRQPSAGDDVEWRVETEP